MKRPEHLYFIQYQKDYLLPHAFYTETDAKKFIEKCSKKPLWDKKEDYEIVKIHKEDPDYEWDIFNWGRELLAKEEI